MSVTIGGEFSGLNVSSIIQAVIAADSIPITNLETQDTNLQKQSTNLGTLGSSLGSLSNALQALGSNSLFTSQTATSSSTTVGTAASSGSASNGSFSINVTQLATSTCPDQRHRHDAHHRSARRHDQPQTALGRKQHQRARRSRSTASQITLSSTDTISDVVNAINSSSAGVTASLRRHHGQLHHRLQFLVAGHSRLGRRHERFPAAGRPLHQRHQFDDFSHRPGAPQPQGRSRHGGPRDDADGRDVHGQRRYYPLQHGRVAQYAHQQYQQLRRGRHGGLRHLRRPAHAHVLHARGPQGITRRGWHQQHRLGARSHLGHQHAVPRQTHAIHRQRHLAGAPVR